MRFRRKTKIFPGVYLNFSKSGISTTIGIPGASFNIGPNGTFLNTGIPGTGIYNRKRIDGFQNESQIPEELQPNSNPQFNTISDHSTEIKSQNAEALTSNSLDYLKQNLIDCYSERKELIKEINSQKNKFFWANFLLFFSYLTLVGLFVKWFKENRSGIGEYLDYLNDQLKNCHIILDLKIDPDLERLYQGVYDSFIQLVQSQKIWDLTSSRSVDRYSTRSAASSEITRKPVTFGFRELEIMKSKFQPMFLKNANGGDLYFYPPFIAFVEGDKEFGLIDIREIDFEFRKQKFIEEENVPKDAVVVGSTWAKVNKDGSRDRRFKENYEIPICLYGEIEIKSKTGLHEAYAFSNCRLSEDFYDCVEVFKNSMKL